MTDTVAAGSQRLAVPPTLDTPALVVDVDIMTANLTAMAELCRRHRVALYPHAKTHRIPEIGRLQVQTGADGLTVAKLGEAAAFVDAGIERIVVAYPLVGAAKVARAVALADRASLTLATDDLEAGRAIGRAFADRGRTAQVYVIVDSGLGRCGVTAARVPALARELAREPGLRLTGLMTHEGSVYSAASGDDVVARSHAAADLMVACAASCADAGVPMQTVSLGSSASVRSVVGRPGVTQVRPGIYAFNDLGQIVLGQAVPQTCAVRVLATVVSHPEPGRACIDAGSKSLSQDPVPPLGMAAHPGFGLLADRPGWRIDRLSEEHGWLRWAGSGAPTALAVGEQVQIIPNHVCTVFSSLREATAVQGGEVVGQWQTLGAGASR